MMKRLSLNIIGLLALGCLPGGLAAQVFPYSQNSWSNPGFVERFMGSYGFLSDREPQITTEEAKSFQEVGRLLETSQFQQAYNFLRDIKGAESTAAVDFTMGNILLQMGRRGEAQQSYKAAISKYPNFLRAYKNLGLALVQDQKYVEGLAAISKAIELGGNDGVSYGLLGYCFLNTDRLSFARDSYSMARILDPENKDWSLGLAQALSLSGDHLGAVPVFQDLLTDQPRNKQLYVGLANSYIGLKEFDKAIQYLEILRRLQLADEKVMVLLGDIYMSIDLYGLALERYETAIQDSATPDEKRIQRLADSFIQRNALTEAESLLETVEGHYGEALSDDFQISLLNLKSVVSLRQGDRPKAVDYLQQVLKKDPFNGRALLLLGNFFAETTSDLAQAKYYYDLAIQQDAVRHEALIQYGRLLVRERAYRDAVARLEEAQNLKYQSTVARYIESIQRVIDNGS